MNSTFVCPTEILAFNDRAHEFRALNTEVLAASVDSHFTHLAWVNTPRTEGGLGQLTIPLLSDLTHKISIDYGVYLEDVGHTLRGLFIIDDKQVLRQITMNDLPVGRSVDETLRLVQAFQYTDRHGEVCPAGWKPGSDTVIFFSFLNCLETLKSLFYFCRSFLIPMLNSSTSAGRRMRFELKKIQRPHTCDPIACHYT